MPKTQVPQPSPELESIQILRAVAACAVLISHAGQNALSEIGYEVRTFNFDLGAAGVDLFFVISGFVMVYASERLFAQPAASRQFLGRRLLRILPLYWGLTTLALVGHHGFHLPPHLDLRSVIGSYLFVPVSRPGGASTPVMVVGWTLNYEMLFYAIFAMAVSLPRGCAIVAVSAVLLAAAALSWAFPDLPVPWRVWASPITGEFVLGMVIALALRRGWGIPPVVAAGMVIAALGAMAYFHARGLLDETPMANGFSRVLTWGVAAALLVSAVVLSTSRLKMPPILRPLVELGDASYALYLCHSFVPFAIGATSLVLLLSPMRFPYVYSAIFVAISIAAAFVLNRCDEQLRLALLRVLPKKTSAADPNNQPSQHRPASLSSQR